MFSNSETVVNTLMLEVDSAALNRLKFLCAHVCASVRRGLGYTPSIIYPSGNMQSKAFYSVHVNQPGKC